MSSNKRKRDPGETNSPKDNKQIPTKGKEKRGRNKKETTEEEKKIILEEVEREIEKSYKKTIGLNENNIISYSSEEMTNFPNHFSKQLSKMIKVFIYNLNQDPNNEYTNEIDFAKKIKKIISILNMNENDFAFFTILLDKIGWQFGKDYELFEHLHYIGILTMQYSSGKFINIKNDKFNRWKNGNIIGDDELRAIDIKETNKRKEELLSADDEGDPDKFLDYNQMVDDIIMNARIYKDNK